VKARYDTFRATNPAFFAHLDALEEEINTKLEAADKAVRARGISCGDFHLYSYSTKYNPEELLQAMGREKFMQVGGTMTTQTVYGVDKARVDASIASKDIDESVAEKVRVKQPRYHSPKKLVVL
jgi:hypothetical protein